MKRILSIVVILLFALTLSACRNAAGEVKATLSNLDVGLTSMTFTITLDDPKEEITGTITLTLYDSANKVVHNKDIAELAELQNYQISGLINEMKYTLKLSATIGRKLVVLLDREINLASSETVHIKTPAEFLAMANNRAGNYVLDNDIDFEFAVFNTPFTSPFSGTFDGKGFSIKNVVFDKVIQYTGIFGYVSGGVIKNVTFDHIQIGTPEAPLAMTTSSRVGIVAGYLASSTGKIENVHVINSSINYATSSTVQAYVGGLVGESRGLVTNASIKNSTVSVKSTSYGRIRLGGAVGMLGEEAVLKEILSEADVHFEMAVSSMKDRDLNINIGGIVGYHNARNINRSVEHLISSGDISVELNFGTIAGTTKGSYSVYVGGISGIAYSNIHQALYSGSITLNHEKNDNEANVNKYFFVGGIHGFYGSNKGSQANLRYSDNAKIEMTLSDDVTLICSQTVAEVASTAVNVFSYYGDLSLMLNANDLTGSDAVIVVATLEGFFTSEFIQNYLLA